MGVPHTVLGRERRTRMSSGSQVLCANSGKQRLWVPKVAKHRLPMSIAEWGFRHIKVAELCGREAQA